jgi:hypothetical protein
MFGFIFIVAIVSFIFIFVIHSLLVFFKKTLTVPKMKDLVHSPTEKYKQMYETIQQQNHQQSDQNDSSPIDLLPTDDSMKDELKEFLKQQLSL